MITRCGVILALLYIAVGCAAKKAVQPPPTTAEAPATQPVYEESASAALVFQPPIAMGEPQLALSREGREIEAFMGFDQTSTTYHYVRFDDRQSDDFEDGYERRSVTVQVGVSQR